MKESFRINIEQSVLNDLRRKIERTRWPDEIANLNWSYGTDRSYLEELCSFWLNDFDWRKQEEYLNSFNHFTTMVDGEKLHFIHQKSNAPYSIPLLLIHGWPDSFYRFHKIIPMLSDFDLVIPSIPGHGFSGIPEKSGMNTKRIAKLFTHLMTDELGYERFVAHGGDVGSEIVEQIALYHHKSVLGIHLTDIPYHHILGLSPEKLNHDEKAYLDSVTKWQMAEGAYNMIQATRPGTLASGLNDSPVGLAAWIVDKFHAWSDNNGDIENSFTKNELLTNIMIYWVTETIRSSFSLYHESMKDLMQTLYNPLTKINPFDKTNSKSDVPTAIAQFRTDLLPSRDFANKFFNIQRWTEMPRGGHFAAMEQPALLSNDIRKFIHDLHLSSSPKSHSLDYSSSQVS